MRTWIHYNRRVGRPRASWTEETIRESLDILKQHNDRYRYTSFNEEDEQMVELIKNHTEE